MRTGACLVSYLKEESKEIKECVYHLEARTHIYTHTYTHKRSGRDTVEERETLAHVASTMQIMATTAAAVPHCVCSFARALGDEL